MERDDVQAAVVEWQSMYEELRNISLRQLELSQEENDRDQLPPMLELLSVEWTQKQTAIMAYEQELRELLTQDQLREIFQRRIQPILMETKRNVDDAAHRLDQSMVSIGATLRRTTNYRAASNVYNTTGQGNDIPIFFDEKK